MLEEYSMEKKNSTRGAPGVAKPLPVETKNKQDVVSVARFPRYGRRRDNPVPKPDPPNKVWSHRQRSDKRIQGKNYYSGAGDRYRDQVAATDDAEIGTHAWSGSKKLNLNHLLNFKYDRPEGGRLSSSAWGAGGGSHSGSGRNRGMWVTRKHKYNKEQFLQANCQFVVQEGQDYSVYYADPDLLVDWNCIELIRVHSHELPSCPICLYPPVAAKMTRCGHIYCWPCILHYLALSDKTWRKCPICYEAVHKGDLKSAVTSATPCFAVGEEITMQLMQRERGSVVALPKNRWKKTNGNPFRVGDGMDVCFAKLLVATKNQVLSDIIEREERELTVALRESEGCPEICFVEFASQQLQERKKNLHCGDLAVDSITNDCDEKDGDVAITVKIPDTLKTVTYASAFYDEEIVDETADEFKEIEVTDSENTQGYEQRHRNESLGTDSLDDGDILERMNELKVREDICEMTVEEKLPNKDVFYFYQATDGQHMYLHAINVHMLIREYGSLDQCPDTVTGVILEKEGISMNEELRHRLRYLGHLPLICEFEVVELQLRPPIVSQTTVDAFTEELEKRRRRRNHRARAENKRERQLQAEENRKLGKIPSANIRLDSMKQFPECGTKLPSELDIIGSSGTERVDSATGHNEPSTTCSSPTSSLSAGSPENTTAGPSFAQMLCRGKAKPQTFWPSAPAVKSCSGGNSDSEGDGFMAPPSFRDSFGAALQAAIDRNTRHQNIPDDNVAVGFDKSHKKKKGKQKRLLFTTNVIRNK